MTPVCKVGKESIPVIKDLAERTWKAACASFISPEQVNYMLDLFYSETALEKQMDEGHQFIVAKEKNKVIGFASYSAKSAQEPRTHRLHKIYIDPDWQGKGIGKLLIGFIINEISFDDATHLELNIDRRNKALDFYQKIGFRIIKEEVINIGNGFFMNDYVLSLVLQTYPVTS